MCTKWHKTAQARTERGAALVEFALIFPFFMMLVLGLFTGGQAYDRKLQLTHASREAARYGASLAGDETFPAPTTWATTVRDVAISNSGGLLNADQICVALVSGTNIGTATGTDFVWKGGNSGAESGATAGCYDDDTTDGSQERVQVLTQRGAKIQLLFRDIDIRLRARGTSLHEEDD
ncbi:MAG: TadE/TadG family type IV pilus assembly protein [Acidimicrobiales bacterium]